MDFIHGDNLDDELRDYQALMGHPTPPSTVVEDALVILDVLDYLHNLDPPIIHRDIKPANIIRAYETKRADDRGFRPGALPEPHDPFPDPGRHAGVLPHGADDGRGRSSRSPLSDYSYSSSSSGSTTCSSDAASDSFNQP